MPLPAILAAIAPKLGATLAGAALGGLMNRDNPGQGMVLGGLGGLGVGMNPGIFSKLLQGGLLKPQGMQGMTIPMPMGGPVPMPGGQQRPQLFIDPNTGEIIDPNDPQGAKYRYQMGYNPLSPNQLPPLTGG